MTTRKPLPDPSTIITKPVYLFANGRADGDASMGDLLGGKGANLAEMVTLGLPVPPGFTLTTEVCGAFNANGQRLPDTIAQEVTVALDVIGRAMDAGFGRVDRPLLVSVRSGGRVSMPGMMDTILNLGLNDQTVEGLAALSNDARFAYDSYRRFIQMYAHVVLGVDPGVFEDILDNDKNLHGFAADSDVDVESWRRIIARYFKAIESEVNAVFPQDVQVQLWGAIGAVFRSWHTPRAKTYRQFNRIPDAWGTAVNVQAMVFGNRGSTSATGVAFTRNPSTGARELYGEFLVNAQGEDVVAGIRTPQVLTEAGKLASRARKASLETLMPRAFGELAQIVGVLEAHFRDMQDIEFTIENDHLWILQTRSGKRSVEAAMKIAVDMAGEGLITSDEALLRIDPESLHQLLHPTLDPNAPRQLITTGLPASPGAAFGEIVFTADEAEAAKAKDRAVILVRSETSPEDVHGMHAAVGVLTARGGMTSHAAVVARGLGRPCVVGAGALRIDPKSGTMTAGRDTYHAGEVITIDGATGQVIKGAAQMRQPELSGAFGAIMQFADQAKRLSIRANADSARDGAVARSFGAQGIGLCRTEPMFFEQAALLAMREMILAETPELRRAALAKILPLQRAELEALFETMAGWPVTIRLLDPPLREFLPSSETEIGAVAAAIGVTVTRLRARIDELAEVNPMLGVRGARVVVLYPEIAEMQVRAILEAAVAAGRKTGAFVLPEIKVPFVAYRSEYDRCREVIEAVAQSVARETGVELAYEIGATIELPRACLQADTLAEGAQGCAFFSFGTNDLTQTTLGLSRDDAGQLLAGYQESGVLAVDPFVSIDLGGVGELMAVAVQRGRAVRPDLKIGICGEHGGDPASVEFCHGLGMDYVSCVPLRVPVARLAAAQAAIRAAQKRS